MVGYIAFLLTSKPSHPKLTAFGCDAFASNRPFALEGDSAGHGTSTIIADFLDKIDVYDAPIQFRRKHLT